LTAAMATLLADSPIGRVEQDVRRDCPLPAVAVREQAFLVVVELLGCLGRELEVRSQDDGVDRAGLLIRVGGAANKIKVHSDSSPLRSGLTTSKTYARSQNGHFRLGVRGQPIDP
jgi:hypothetical protein